MATLLALSWASRAPLVEGRRGRPAGSRQAGGRQAGSVPCGALHNIGGASARLASIPSEHTRALHAAALAELPFEDREDFEDASRGLIAAEPSLRVTDARGRVVWD